MNTINRWSEDEMSLMLTMLDAGASDREIAEKIGRTPLAVRRKRSLKTDIRRRDYQPWRTSELKQLVKMVELGFSDSGIAAVLNRTPKSIKTARQRHTDDRKNVTVDSSYYEKIQSLREQGKNWSEIGRLENANRETVKYRFYRAAQLCEASA